MPRGPFRLTVLGTFYHQKKEGEFRQDKASSRGEGGANSGKQAGGQRLRREEGNATRGVYSHKLFIF